MVTNRSAEHWITSLQRIENRALRDRRVDRQRDLTVNARKGSQVLREDDANHRSVWTSTDNTLGRSRTMDAQWSPPSADA